jgi:alkylated DNA repair dioxygenase AlkB
MIFQMTHSFPKQKTLFEVLKIKKPPETNESKATPETKTSTAAIPPHETEDWKYMPGFITKEDVTFEDLLAELQPLVREYFATIKGKDFAAKRLSCKFSDINDQGKIAESTRKVNENALFNYDQVIWHDWSKSPLVSKIRALLQKALGFKFDYCLAHLYRNGKDTIGYHSDKEGLNGQIVSISMGATRKFRFRRMMKKSGYDYEFQLRCGDCLLMKIGCQWNWVHSVPPELTINDPRINLTFRMF